MVKKLASMIYLSVGLLLSSPMTYASGTILSTQSPTVPDSTSQQLGNIQVVLDAGSLREGDALVVSLPEFASYGSTYQTEVESSFQNRGNFLVMPLYYNGNPNWDGNEPPFEISQLDKRRIVIKSLINQSAQHDLVFYLQFGNIHIDKGSYGAININFEPSPGSGFPQGNVTIGKVFGEKTTFSLTSSNYKQNDNIAQFILRLEEDQFHSFQQDKPLKLRLPQGFIWVGFDKSLTLQGSNGDVRIEQYDDREIRLIRLNQKGSTASTWEIPLEFKLKDQSKPETGDVTLDIQWDQTSRLTVDRQR